MEKLLKAAQYALCGLCYAFARERAFRQECLLFLLFFIVSFFLANTMIEFLLLNGALFLILITELLNTAIEKTLDRISTDKNPYTKIAKDVSSAAVFLSLVLGAGTWIGIWISHF